MRERVTNILKWLDLTCEAAQASWYTNIFWRYLSKLAAAFMSCVDTAPISAEYKLLQMWQYLSGEALKSTEALGHSALILWFRLPSTLSRPIVKEVRQISWIFYSRTLESNVREITNILLCTNHPLSIFLQYAFTFCRVALKKCEGKPVSTAYLC